MSTNWTAYRADDTKVALETHPTRKEATDAVAAYIDRIGARIVSSTENGAHLKLRDGSGVRVVIKDL